MPQTKTYDSLYVKVPINVPSTVEEFDENAKRKGACLDEAINNCVYRGVLAEFRDLLIHGREAVAAKDGQPEVLAVQGLESLTGIERKTEKKTVGKKEVEVYSESEAEYVRRVIAAKGWDTEKPDNELQAIATEVAKHLVFDASASERKPAGPKVLPKDYLESAKRIIANGNFDKHAARLGLTSTGDVEKDTIALGWKIRDEVLAEQREKTAKYA